jgi:SulP family sulfate permease
LKSFGRFAGYSLSSFRRDLVAGLIVGIVAIPLGMAFAIAAGVKPQYGIYTSIVAGFLISLLGGSKFQIGGPTGAFIPILFGVVVQYGYEKLLAAGMLAGAMLALMGLFRLGGLIRYIPRPVTIGFTSGIAVIIFTGQIGNFLGLEGLQRHERFLPNMRELVLHLTTLNPYSVVTAAVSLGLILLAARRFPRIPGALVGLIGSTLVASLLFRGRLPTIGSVYGAIPQAMPSLQFPHLSLEQWTSLLQPAFVIAMLGAIESLLSAVVADGMSGDKHNSNRELIGQGIANIAAPLFGGIPATGAIARTATNIRSGAASPVSGMVHALTVLAAMALFAPYASDIPLAAMAPILMTVAWNMSERKSFVRLLKARNGETLVMVATFLLTVLADLTIAVEAGLALAVLLFLRGMRQSLQIAKVLPDPAASNAKVRPHMVREGRDCPQIGIFNVDGPLFFGAADRFESAISPAISPDLKVLVLRMGKVPVIDSTGEAHLADIVRRFRSRGGVVLVTGIQPQPRAALDRSGLSALIGEQRFFDHTGDAIRCALTLLDAGRCLGCRHFAFRECAGLSGGAEAAAIPAQRVPSAAAEFRSPVPES